MYKTKKPITSRHTRATAACANTVVIALPALLAALTGCASRPEIATASPLPMLVPRVACASLAGLSISAPAIGLPTRGAQVSSATLVAQSAARTDPATGVVTHALPEYCKVLGDILPVNPNAPSIKFQVNVPTRWNQKTIQIGGGGLNGSIPANLAAIGKNGSPVSAAHPPDAAYPLAKGYASFGGDSGHQGGAADWMLNDEAWINYGYASLKKTHDAAVAVIQALYKEGPKVSYFMGTSNGGREALEVAQRFPADYDGVVAHVPLIGWTAHAIAKTLSAKAQVGGGWISPDKAKVIGAEVVRQCDGLDGIVDGVISNYLACNALFDPQRSVTPYGRIRCEGGTDTGATCMSDTQIATVNKMHDTIEFGFELANGLSTSPGYGVGRESETAWLNLAIQPGLPAEPSLAGPATILKYGFLKEPKFNVLNFSIANYKEKIQAASRIVDASNPDLSKFFERGGRLIIKSSSSDYSVNPRAISRYYDTVVAKFGQALVDAHLRYYVLANAGHSGTGASATTGEPIPHYVDMIKMMTDWVEQDITPPDAPVVRAMSATPPYAVSATKPMCRYPLYPRYAGGGDPKRVESYVCAAP